MDGPENRQGNVGLQGPSHQLIYDWEAIMALGKASSAHSL